MNYFTLFAGIIALIAVIGHFAMGKKMYLTPVLKSDIDEVPKKVVESLFHYMSAFMIITTFFLIWSSFGMCRLFEHTNEVALFIGIIYGGFAITQFIIALISSIKMGPLKMFQWIFWMAISVLSILGGVLTS
ncbi:MAG: hypothetical protein ISR57_05780 [Bacteroidales bacterium]|nr:hypothetical protein [Bacteroidota bacterium]MBL6950137.1 hypothetical protein [Bacteroidales bacterium]